MRNRNAIKDINRRISAAKTAMARQRLIDMKDRLMHEMWQACPHELIAHASAVKTTKGPCRMRFCTSCGFDESVTSGSFMILIWRPGRKLTRFEARDFSVKLGQTLRWTGINI
jgi:hypothetical protein